MVAPDHVHRVDHPVRRRELAALGERERLDTILERTRAAMQENKLTVAAPIVETSENKLTLSFDVEGLVIEGDAIKVSTYSPPSCRVRARWSCT
jgi:hypothetical protein